MKYFWTKEHHHESAVVIIELLKTWIRKETWLSFTIGLIWLVFSQDRDILQSLEEEAGPGVRPPGDVRGQHGGCGGLGWRGEAEGGGRGGQPRPGQPAAPGARGRGGHGDGRQAGQAGSGSVNINTFVSPHMWHTVTWLQCCSLMSVSLQCCSLMSVLLQCCSLMSVLLQCCVCWVFSCRARGRLQWRVLWLWLEDVGWRHQETLYMRT